LIMTRRRIIYLLALIGSLVFYMAYQQWFAWILLQVVVLFPWLSLLLSIAGMVCLRMDLVVPTRVSMGDAEKMQLEVFSKLPYPPHSSKIRITNPMTGERRTLKPGVNLPTEHCGKLRVELRRAGVCDYLGLFRFRARKASAQTVLVWPKPVKMKIPSELIRHMEPRWHPKPGGGYAENYEIREFHPGDNLNKIHWKLSAKVGDLMLREPMEPQRGLMLVTMDLSGTSAELDKKLGQLLWLGRWMLEREVAFEVRVLTPSGIESWAIHEEEDAAKCIETLLSTPSVKEGSIRDQSFQAAWRYHIGGEQNEG